MKKGMTRMQKVKKMKTLISNILRQKNRKC